MSKRGVLGISFVWLFIAIVGAMFLLFFIKLSFDLKNTSQELNDKIMVLKVKDILVSGSSSTGYFTKLNLPLRDEMSLSFNSNNYLQVYNGKKFLGQVDMGSNIIFSLEIKNKEVLLWSERWNVPFYVSNFVFLTTSDRKYTFTGKGITGARPSKIVNDFIDDLKKNIPFENVEINGRLIPLRAGGDSKIIFFSSNDYEHLNCVGRSGNYDVEIVFEKNTGEYGYICYWGYDSDNERIPFIGKSMIYGAIFSDDYETFKSLNELSFNRMEKLIDLYVERSSNNEILKERFTDLRDAVKDRDLKKIYETMEELNRVHYNIAREKGKYVY